MKFYKDFLIGYTKIVESKTKRYKIIANVFTVPVVEHLLKYIEILLSI